MKKFIPILLLLIIFVSCNQKQGKELNQDSSNSFDSYSKTNHSHNTSSEQPEKQTSQSNDLELDFYLVGNIEDKKTMKVGDNIGSWVLNYLDIQMYQIEESDMQMGRVSALFNGEIMVKGTAYYGISEMDNLGGFRFTVDKEDMCKFPRHYFDYGYPEEEIFPNDIWFEFSNFDEASEMFGLSSDESKECTIIIKKYEYLYFEGGGSPYVELVKIVE